MKKILVSVIMGSRSDSETMQEATRILDEFRVPYEVRVLSAHRSPKEVARFAEAARKRGIRVIIAGAGGAAALAGVVGAHTTLPIIGVPIETKSLKGLDSLLSTVQMPRGVPVATMAIGKAGAINAALFALQILGLNDPKVRGRLGAYRKRMRGKKWLTRSQIRR